MSGGRVRRIRQVPDPVLRAACESVNDFGDALQVMVADMFATMDAAGGVGLAANQLGVAKRVFVYDCPDARGVRHRGVVVNPELNPPKARSEEVADVEGCLSIAGQHAMVSRQEWASVVGLDLAGCSVLVEGTGVLARCLLHETDHLCGALYVDLLSSVDRARILDAHAATAPDCAGPGAFG